MRQRGVIVFDFVAQGVEAFFEGLLARELAFDGERLILLGDGRVLASLAVATVAWHPGAGTALSLAPLAVHWLTGTAAAEVARLPRGASESERLVLADALEERGGPGTLVSHLRERCAHGKRCWAIEALRDAAR